MLVLLCLCYVLTVATRDVIGMRCCECKAVVVSDFAPNLLFGETRQVAEYFLLTRRNFILS